MAKKAGVSTKTVSRVINHQGEIRTETRQRVQAVIDELGYRPNMLARSLVSQRSRMLGVVAWGLDYYAPSRIVVGIEQRSSELGYSLFLHLMPHPTEAGAESILNTLADHRVEGIIWAVPEVADNHAWIQAQALQALPPIVFLSTCGYPGLDSISVDNQRGGELAVQHLVEQGRKQIGIIRGPAAWWETGERLAGWREALLRNGLEPAPRRIAGAEWSVESGAQAMRDLLEQDPQIEAVFASSDDIALGAMTAASQAGRRIPEDLALVGFDNIPQSAYFQPPLTTIDQPLSRMGCMAVEVLIKRIESRRGGKEDEPPTALMLEPRLVVRSSSRGF